MNARSTRLGGSLAAIVAAAISAASPPAPVGASLADSTAASAGGSHANPGTKDAVVPVAAGTAASPLRLVAADSGRAMTLPVGAVLRVELDANYSTGSEWQRRDAFGAVLDSVPCEGLVREPLVKAGEPAPPVGTGSLARYCFRAAAPGRAFLYLFYGRAWQPDSSPLGSFNLDVTVTPAA